MTTVHHCIGSFLITSIDKMMNNSEGLQPIKRSLLDLPQWLTERVLQQINQLTRYEPVIGIMGKTGSGKSSLCNALFAGEVSPSPVNDVSSCTREPLSFRLQVGERFITIMDLPGVGESGVRDTEYAELYRELLPRLDLMLWLIKADDRALAVDEHFYQGAIGEACQHKVLFVISQSDKAITQRLLYALILVEIRVLDHLIVGGTQILSFAEHGLLSGIT